MTTIVVLSGGYHPYHAGHYALYQSAQRTFPDAEVYVAATNDTSSRPFPFAVKEKLARLAGVEAGHFVQVKSPFRAEEITAKFDPSKDVLIFVRSEKDAKSQPQPGGVKKDGSPSYLQPLLGARKLEPFARHAYMAYLPTVEFGPGMTSATQIRSAWPGLDERRKTALVMSLYPKTQTSPKLAATVVKLLDAAIGGQEVAEGSGSSIEKKIQAKQDSLSLAREQRRAKGQRQQGQREIKLQAEIDKLNTELTQLKQQGVAEGLNDTQKKIEDTINKLEDRLKHAKSDEQWDRISARIERLQAGLNRSKQGVAEGLSKRDQQDVAAIRAAIARLQAQLNHPNADHDAIQQSIAHEKKRLALYGQGVAEGAPIVVALAPIDVRNPKKAPQPYRNQGDIVPPTTPPSTEKRGVKGRPGQRPMPDYTKDVDENQGWAATFTNEDDYIEEKWSSKYKSSINCAAPQGFSQRAHCAGRKK